MKRKIKRITNKKKYSIIAADPPWPHMDEMKHRGGSQKHYKGKKMSLADIKNLPVSTISEDSSALFLWITAPMITLGKEVIEAWGFQYKTVAFTWIKYYPNGRKLVIGQGHYTRANPEFCLLGTKGKIKRINKSVHSVVQTRREEHSKKPNIAKKRMVDLFGDLPRIELFARNYPIGWDVWGNEIKSSIVL